MWICAACHDEIHEGLKVIEGWITTTNGKELAWHEVGVPDQYMPGAKPKLYGEKNEKG